MFMTPNKMEDIKLYLKSLVEKKEDEYTLNSSRIRELYLLITVLEEDEKSATRRNKQLYLENENLKELKKINEKTIILNEKLLFFTEKIFLENCDLKSEINRLNNELHSKVEYIHEQTEIIESKKAEIERLQNEIGSLNKAYPCTVQLGEHCLLYARTLDDYDKQIGDISNEAIKDYLFKLIDVAVCRSNGDGTEGLYIKISKAREILEKMRGDEND